MSVSFVLEALVVLAAIIMGTRAGGVGVGLWGGLGTFVLVFVILIGPGQPALGGPLFVALLVVGIGASLGGPTGYAINPARDIMPRIAHAILPIKGKGGSDWGYSWVPVVGPLIGGALAALAFNLLGGSAIIPGVS